MSANYETLLVDAERLEPFVLCLALGTLEAMKSHVWPSEAGVWTIGRPGFLSRLESSSVSPETLDLLVQFDELNALEKLVEREAFVREVAKVEQKLKKRLEEFAGHYWKADWAEK